MRTGRFTLRHGKSDNIPKLHPNELGFVEDLVKLLIGTKDGNVQLNTRVKGNSEENYRTGDVNITKDNIGLDKVDNTADKDKNVKSAETAKTAENLSTSVSVGAKSKPVYFDSGVPKEVESIDPTLLNSTDNYNINISGKAKSAETATTAENAKYIATSKNIGSEIIPVYIAYDADNKRGYFVPCTVPVSGNYKNFVPHVSDGVMETGKYIDMHEPASEADYDVRLTATSGALNCSGTFTATKVFNAVWNDYADALLRDDIEDPIQPGYIVAKSYDRKGYVLADRQNKNMVVGVCSDTYGHLLGGEQLENMEDNLKKYVPVGVAGNVRVMITGRIKAGDLVTVSKIPGVGKKASRFFHKPGTIVGKVLENKNYDGNGRVLMQVMLL